MAKGDVANVTGESEANDTAVPKETRPKKRKSTTTTKTAASTRPRRDRGRNKTAREKEDAETSKPAARASSKATKKDAVGDKKATTTKKGGVKRENNSLPGTRQPKRSRTIPVFEPRQTRSRSASRRLASKKEVVSRKHEEVKIIAGDDQHIVPLDFRLQRESFDGATFDRANFTEGIAHYDAARRSDPQKVAEYITDLFQHLYKAEVRCCLPT